LALNLCLYVNQYAVKLMTTQIPLQAVLTDRALIIIEDTRSELAVTITQTHDTLCITLNRLPLGIHVGNQTVGYLW